MNCKIQYSEDMNSPQIKLLVKDPHQQPNKTFHTEKLIYDLYKKAKEPEQLKQPYREKNKVRRNHSTQFKTFYIQ